MREISKFELTEEDFGAVEIASNVARRLLRHPRITPRQIVGLGNALYALERLPRVTPGACCEFGISYRKGTDDSEEMIYFDFNISDSEFRISQGGSVYEKSVGGDSHSAPDWVVEVDGYRETECDLYDIESSIEAYLRLGAEITVNDESDMEYE